MSRSLVLTVLGAGVFVATAVLAKPPELVSPQGLSADRCPTFSWSAVSGAAGYELVVYGVTGEGEVGKTPLLSVRLPGGAASWTPPSRSCLAAGGRYAWTLRAMGKEREAGWSEPALFEVEAAPSVAELEAAIATLRRYLPEARSREAEGEDVALRGDGPAGRPREVAASGPAGGGLESVTAASVPALGNPSLTVDANVSLGASSNFFKDGSVFLWDDTTGNTALGRLALSSATGFANGNTAVGLEALRYTVASIDPSYGSYNTALGERALRSNTTGRQNTASGARALYSNDTGSFNTASGYGALGNNTTGTINTAGGFVALFSNTTGVASTAIGKGALYANTTGHENTALGRDALRSNTTGSRNTAVGPAAGFYATTGNDNIFLGYAVGSAGDANTIRIGGGTGTGVRQQNRTFIAGIRNITTTNNDAITVLIDSAGQLGTTSSSQSVKQDIREIGDMSQRLLELRPVAFRYRQHVAADAETPLQFGLIAEEVAEVFPELVVRDVQGRPESVKYHLLSALLLNELQRSDREVGALRDRLAALERVQSGGKRGIARGRPLGGGRNAP